MGQKKRNIASQRLLALRLAKSLGNVSEACRRSGIPRSTFYWALKHPPSSATAKRRSPRMPNALPSSVRVEILALTRAYPRDSYPRIATKLAGRGIRVSPSSVRKLWTKLGITTARRRAAWASPPAPRSR